MFLKKKNKTKPFKKLLADLIWNTIQLNALNVHTAISMQLFKQCILLHTNIIYHLQNKTACGHTFHKRNITLLHITYIYAVSVTKLISFFKIVSQYLDFLFVVLSKLLVFKMYVCNGKPNFSPNVSFFIVFRYLLYSRFLDIILILF